MFNARQLLDQLMQNSQGNSGSSSSPGQQHNKGGLFDNPAISGALSGLGGGLLAGLLMNNKKLRKLGGSVATYGGAAALGAIALTAYRNWKSNQTSAAGVPAPLPAERQSAAALEFDLMPAAQVQAHSRIMLSALVAAAKADGQFDEREKQLIRDQVNQTGDAETVEWVQQEIRKPLDINQVAALADSPEMAAEIYLVSLAIIDEQNDQEKQYLNALGDKLRLEPPLRAEIGRQLQQAGG